MEIENKRILVVGMARSGVAAAELLLRHGATPVLTDMKPEDAFGDALDVLRDTRCEFCLGMDGTALLDTVDGVVISPGVPIDAPVPRAAREKGLALIGELELAARLMRGELMAITGTNGKTTTTTLLGRMLENAGRKTYVAGNIGYPLSSVALESRDEDAVVAEVSSFQLESVERFHPRIAALLNITEDHLNRHGTMERYIALKERLFENQTEEDTAILNMDDPLLLDMAKRLKGRVLFFSRTQPVENGAFVENGKLIWQMNGVRRLICDAEQVMIPGPHNLENALAATAMACAAGVPSAVIQHTLMTFTGVEHRIEKVRVHQGVVYINDSKGTNVDSTIKAVQSMKAPTVLILGGYDKHTDFSPMCQEIVQSGRIRDVVVMGQTSRQIREQLEEAGYTRITRAYSMEDAVEKARALACPGGNVLLSPACASFDMFSDFEQRGKVFKDLVNALQ